VTNTIYGCQRNLKHTPYSSNADLSNYHQHEDWRFLSTDKNSTKKKRQGKTKEAEKETNKGIILVVITTIIIIAPFWTFRFNFKIGAG
jgi:hypothetical protein